MKAKLTLTVLCAVLIGGTPLFAQKTGKVIDRIIELGQTENKTTEWLDVLSNRFGGRLIGSDAYDNAADWCEYMFRQWGLEVWREEVGELPVGFNRGPWFGRMIGGNNMTLNFVTPSYTAGTKGVQRGHVVKEPKSRAEFERMKKTLNGAWVLITGESTGWPIDYSAAADSVRAAKIANKEDEPALFYREMKEAGILGIIQSSAVPMRCLYDRKNIMSMTFDNLPDLPDIKLDEQQYEIIRKMVERGEYFLLEFDIRNHFKMGPVKHHNIVGVLKGSKYPDEYVMAGGHLDAYDVATGGVDCCVGVTPTMEAARLITKAGGKPERTILFCLWSGEEFGLLGSTAFVEQHPEMMDKISNYFNRDYGPLATTGITVPPAMYEDFAAIEPALNKINPDFPFKVQERKGPAPKMPTTASGSDHAPFQLKGVPVYSFQLTDPKGYNFNYGEIWHTDRDLYNKSIPEYQEHAAVVTAVTLYHLANLDHILDRTGMYSE